MRIVIAPDSFKGSLNSAPAAAAIAAGLREVDGTVDPVLIPMADGGEGTVEAISILLGGEIVSVTVHDPLDRPVEAGYGWVEERKLAIVEMAAASGLPLLKDDERDPLGASTRGTGELLRDALERGAREVILGLGGSATNDGGMGFLTALGVRFLDHEDETLRGCGVNLAAVRRIDASGLDSRLREVRVTVASDVDNPLLGEHGATHVFGPQKGVEGELLEELENGMAHYAQLMVEAAGRDCRETPGAGAAGGFGFGLMSLMPQVTLRSGFSLIAELGELERTIRGAALVITGEGKLDSQSLHGKVPVGIARIGREAGVPVAAFAGRIDGEPEDFRAEGIQALVPIVDQPMDLATAMREAEALLTRAAARFWQTVRLGRRLGT